MKFSLKVVTSVAMLYFSLLLPSFTHASVYKVSIDTSTLSGTAAQLALDFIDGGLPNNTITVSSFATTGTLGATASLGDVTGALPGTVTLGDADFFNEHMADILLGTSISFIFTPTANPPDVMSLPDAFSLFLLDPLSGLPLFATTDPTGADALFHLDIDDTVGGTLQVFDATNQEVAVSVISQNQTVPLPGSLALFSVGFYAVLAVRRRTLLVWESKRT